MNLKISQFTSLAASSQSPNYILPLADTDVTNYQMTLNAMFSNIGANTTSGLVTSTTVSTGAAVSNPGLVVTRGDNLRLAQLKITTDAAPAPQLLLQSEIITAQGDNVNRLTFLKSNQGGGQAPASATLGTIRFCTNTESIVAAEAVVSSVQSSGGYGNTFCYYTTRSGTVSTAGIFAVDNWGTFRVGRNLSNSFADIQLSDPTKLFMLGAADNLNDSTNTALHIRGTADTMKNLVLQSRASQGVAVFEHRSSSNALLLQISQAGAFSPGSAAAVDLATALLPFKDFYLAGSSGTPGTNNFRITGAATAARVITLPDATCTLSASASALTPGRVTFATTGGLLTDSSLLLWNVSGAGALGIRGTPSTAPDGSQPALDVVSGEAVFRGYRTWFTDVDAQIRLGNATANGSWLMGITGAATDDFFWLDLKNNVTPFLITSGANPSQVGFSGLVAIGSTSTWIAQHNVFIGSSSRVGSITRAAVSQMADLEQWQGSGGTVLSAIDASGRFYAPTALTSATATAGAQTLPANPDGFLLINVNGTQKKVPYYAN